MSEEVLSRPPPPADERLVYGDGPSRFLDVRRPAGAGPHPAVLCLHGGFWRARYDLLHLGHLCAGLTSHGYVTVSAEYRRLGEPGGGWPGTFDDMRAASQALFEQSERLGIDPLRVVVLGHSAGGHLSLWLTGVEPRLRGAVPLAPVADLAEASRLQLSSGVADELLQGSSLAQACPAHRLPLGRPQRIVHGEADAEVPIGLVRSYADRAQAAGDDVVLDALPGVGHYELIDPLDPAFDRVLAAVDSLIGAG